MRRRVIAAMALTGGLAVAGIAAWDRLSGGPWQIATRSGGCGIEEGIPRAQVLSRCGTPDAAGGQPKRGARGPDLVNFCSAPCDRYGDRVLFYDCDGRLAELKGADAPGCLGVEQR